MKTGTKDAVALAMDWLAQLRDEDSSEPPPGDDEPAAGTAPAAGHLGDAAAPPPAGNSGDAAMTPAVPPGSYWDAGAPDAAGSGDAAMTPPVPPGSCWDAAPLDAAGSGDAAMTPAVPAGSYWDAAAPPAAVAPPDTTSPPGQDEVTANVEITERAVIGDELRIPVAWCEMGSCISRYADPAALGEADIRARATEAGWRADALGRLACPQCQQSGSWFWTAHPAALWDRDTAVAMAALMAAAVREIAGAGGGAGAEPVAIPGGEPDVIPGGEPIAIPAPRPAMARPQGRGRHRGHPAHADRAR